MTALGNLCSIIIFLSLAGSLFSVLALLAKKVLQLALPLWFGICETAFYFVPIILPALWLVPPEKQQWIFGYQVACLIWLTGAFTFLAFYTGRSILAYYALNEYRACDDERIKRVYLNCAAKSGLKKTPVLYFGTLKEPACVVTLALLRPAVILNEAIIKQLTDKELGIVLCHELTHIMRSHHIYQRVFDFVSVIHWFNPFVWIIRNDFAIHCEMDSDQKALSVMNGKVSEIEYATAMLHLMELSAKQRRHKGSGMEALGFILAKQRMSFILNRPSKCRLIISAAVLAFFIALTAGFSLYMSRSYFYPYPAFDSTPEYSTCVTGNSYFLLKKTTKVVLRRHL